MKVKGGQKEGFQADSELTAVKHHPTEAVPVLVYEISWSVNCLLLRSRYQTTRQIWMVPCVCVRCIYSSYCNCLSPCADSQNGLAEFVQAAQQP